MTWKRTRRNAYSSCGRGEFTDLSTRVMRMESDAEIEEGRGKLPGDFGPSEWRRALALPPESVPEALVVHGEYDPGDNLELWKRLLGPETMSPQWNIVAGRHKGRGVAFANVVGGEDGR